MDAKRVSLQLQLQGLADDFPMRQRKPFRSYLAQLSVLEEMLEDSNDDLVLKSMAELTGVLDHLKPNLQMTHPEMLSQAYRKLFKLQSDVQARWVTNYPRTKDLLGELYWEYWSSIRRGGASLSNGIEDFLDQSALLIDNPELSSEAVQLFIADFIDYLGFHGEYSDMKAVLNRVEVTLMQEQSGLL